jgi:hypothetical protein
MPVTLAAMPVAGKRNCAEATLMPSSGVAAVPPMASERFVTSTASSATPPTPVDDVIAKLAFRLSEATVSVTFVPATRR